MKPPTNSPFDDRLLRDGQQLVEKFGTFERSDFDLTRLVVSEPAKKPRLMRRKEDAKFAEAFAEAGW